MPIAIRPLLAAATAWLCLPPLHGQFLLVDREWRSSAAPSASVKFERQPGSGFLGDRFSVGNKGEIWVIDRLRTWGSFSGGEGGENVSLWGGLEARPLRPGELECDCHNLREIQQSPRISRLDASTWRLDFDGLNWSIPGGEGIQFGFNAARWSECMVPVAAAQPLQIFDSKGKLVGPHAGDAGKEFAVQVWGHLPAPIEIRRRGNMWEVTLRSAISLEAASVDRASLRFGPKGALPVAIERQGSALIGTFRAADTGIALGQLNACLRGQRQDGVPFEGCDLLPRR